MKTNTLQNKEISEIALRKLVGGGTKGFASLRKELPENEGTCVKKKQSPDNQGTCRIV